MTVTSSEPTRASIKLRVPGWARNQPTPGSLYAYADALNKPTVFAINGKTVPLTPDRFGYVTVDRVWRTGDSITIEFPMDARKVVADTRVKDDRGRVAIERGPIVYCAEWPDCEGGRALGLQRPAGRRMDCGAREDSPGRGPVHGRRIGPRQGPLWLV